MKRTGTIIIIIGLLGTAFTGFNLITREKVVDVGDLHITAKRNHVVEWSPVIGIAVMLVGGIVYAKGSKSQ